MKLFDLHCDTATRLLGERQSLLSNSFHISLDKASYLERYAQVMAVWTDRRLSDEEGYNRFFEVVNNLRLEIAKNESIASAARTSDEIVNALNSNKAALILAVEDARILCSDISRLDTLYDHGVRVLTLNWANESCIGGAHNTDVGLTVFGKQVVEKCFDLGIVPDISHSSFKGARETIELAHKQGKPIIASHSDSYTVNPHSRNLRDEDFCDIVKLGGLVGINLCPAHLTSASVADISDIISHIEHYLSLGGIDTVAMGCDLDGTVLPSGISGIADIYLIANELQKLNYSTEITKKIMYENAYDFFVNRSSL